MGVAPVGSSKALGSVNRQIAIIAFHTPPDFPRQSVGVAH